MYDGRSGCELLLDAAGRRSLGDQQGHHPMKAYSAVSPLPLLSASYVVQKMGLTGSASIDESLGSVFRMSWDAPSVLPIILGFGVSKYLVMRHGIDF